MHEEAPFNSQNPRTKGAISLGPSENLQVVFKFMALNTGNKIVQRGWDVIPIPYTLIPRVNALGSDQPEQLIFTDRRRRPIGDVKIPGVDPSDVENIEIPGVDASDVGVDNIEIPGVDVAIQEPQVNEIVDPGITPIYPALIESVPVHQVATALEPMTAIKQVDPKLRRYMRARTQTDNYTSSMSGSK